MWLSGELLSMTLLPTNKMRAFCFYRKNRGKLFCFMDLENRFMDFELETSHLTK